MRRTPPPPPRGLQKTLHYHYDRDRDTSSQVLFYVKTGSPVQGKISQLEYCLRISKKSGNLNISENTREKSGNLFFKLRKPELKKCNLDISTPPLHLGSTVLSVVSHAADQPSQSSRHYGR